MSTDNWLTLLAIVVGVGTVAIGWIMAAVISLKVDVGRIKAVLSMMGKKALEALHSPHTPRQDALIEKFADPKETLSKEEWTELSEWVIGIHANPEEDETRRALAHLVSALIQRNFLKPDETPPDI